jgi:hypothetical protein
VLGARSPTGSAHGSDLLHHHIRAAGRPGHVRLLSIERHHRSTEMFYFLQIYFCLHLLDDRDYSRYDVGVGSYVLVVLVLVCRLRRSNKQVLYLDRDLLVDRGDADPAGLFDFLLIGCSYPDGFRALTCITVAFSSREIKSHYWFTCMCYINYIM